MASEVEQRLIKKIEKNISILDSNLFKISRGEEGGKKKILTDLSGSFQIVTPENIEKYHCGEGVRSSPGNLTANKLREYYLHPKLWIIRIRKNEMAAKDSCSI